MSKYLIMESVRSDLRFSVRILLRTPLFTLASLLTLAIGVGATTAMVAIVNSLLFKAVPYPDSDRLIVLSREDGGPLTGQVFVRLRRQLRTLERFAAQSSGFGWSLITPAGAEYVEGLRVSQEYFGVLGVYPALGREFTAEEDLPGGPQVVIISNALWRRHFGGRRDVIGQSVQLGGASRAIVGVMPSGFQTFPSADVWTPLRVSDRDNTWSYLLVGRLKGDTTPAQARSDLQTVWSNVVSQLPGARDERLRSVTLSSYHAAVTGRKRGPLLILLAAVFFLLLVTCANVAGLQLVRATARMKEMAVRAALGGRGRLAQLLLIESVLQSVAGGLLGLLLGWLAVRALPALVPERLLGPGVRVDIDWGVLALALGLSTMTGVLFSLVPILDLRRVEHTNLHQALAALSTRQSTSGRTIRRLRAVAVAEIGLTAVLLVGAGLLIRTYDNLRRVDVGFNPRNVVTASMSFRGVTPPSAEPGTAAVLERTLARLRDLSIVEAAAVASSIPIERGLNLPLERPNGNTSGGATVVDWVYVSGPYFDVFGIPVRAGRPFEYRDGASSPPVAIVNQAFVRTYFDGRSPIGQQVRLARRFQGDPPREIIGIVADVKSASGAVEGEGINALARPAPPIIYVPAAQVPERLLNMAHGFIHANWAVRVRSTDRRAIDAIQTIIRDTQPAAPIVQSRMMTDVIRSEIEMEQFHAVVIGLFAAVAMTLAIVGTYALIAYSVTQRTQEIGIRMAVGARFAQILGQFVREGLTVTIIALGLGLAGSAVLAHTLQSLIWQVDPLDPATFAAAAGLLIVTSTAASFIPAVRGARTEPSRALRLD